MLFEPPVNNWKFIAIYHDYDKTCVELWDYEQTKEHMEKKFLYDNNLIKDEWGVIKEKRAGDWTPASMTPLFLSGLIALPYAQDAYTMLDGLFISPEMLADARVIKERRQKIEEERKKTEEQKRKDKAAKKAQRAKEKAEKEKATKEKQELKEYERLKKKFERATTGTSTDSSGSGE